MMTLRELNAVPAADFVQALAGIFEHSPWVPQRAAAGRPFTSRLALLDAMRVVVEQATPAEQLGLIRAHPRLGVKGRAAVDLTAASAREQRRAGLEACTAQDLAELNRLNDAYLDKFAMPFILAVRGHDPASIIANCARRLAHDVESEQRTALQQIGLIAGYRVADAVASPAGVEVMAMLERLETSADRAALVREWMNAADLELSTQGTEQGSLLGLRRGAADATETLMLGVHVEPRSGALVSDGRLGCLLAIAMMQQLRQKDVWLEFDLALLAWPSDPEPGDAAGLADTDIEHAAVVAVDGVAERAFAVVRGTPHRGAGHPSAAPDPKLVERAVYSLEDFLLHNERMFDDNGTLARNG
jgi:OHCU decarboxylase